MRVRKHFATALLSLALACCLWGCDDATTDGGPGSCVPVAEACNGRDDDCDGMIDEGEGGSIFERSCSTSCGAGVEECEAGEWRYCTAPQPTPELCDGFDNDCNGQVDEGCDCLHGARESCGIDVGVCEPGIRYCQGGQWGDCQLSYDPGELVELCSDGLDNDCDGEIDEECACLPGETQACGVDEGECQPGLMTCGPDSTWDESCVGAVLPEQERCDGLDDDCDGYVDYIASIDFGWDSDEQEVNDSCAEAAPLYNSAGRAEMLEGSGEWVALRVRDEDDLNTYPTLYPAGDEDWYSIRAVEVSDTCIPWFSQCSFIVHFQLQLQDFELAGVEPSDWGLCVTLGSCDSGTGESTTLCTHGSDWRSDYSSYLFSMYWGGSCGSDDSQDVRIRVFSPTGAACGHYRLWTKFDYDDTIECPGD